MYFCMAKEIKSRSEGPWRDYNTTMLGPQGGQGGRAARFLYFGDLDWEGIRLFFRTREANPSLEIKPFSSFISSHARIGGNSRIAKITRSKEGLQVHSPNSSGYWDCLGRRAVRALLAEGKYIPQEIVNYQVVAKILE